MLCACEQLLHVNSNKLCLYLYIYFIMASILHKKYDFCGCKINVSYFYNLEIEMCTVVGIIIATYLYY